MIDLGYVFCNPDIDEGQELWDALPLDTKLALAHAFVQKAEEEKEIIEALEKHRGKKLSPQEVNLALKQARALGEL